MWDEACDHFKVSVLEIVIGYKGKKIFTVENPEGHRPSQRS